MAEPHGFPAFDLVAPSRLLATAWDGPLRRGLTSPPYDAAKAQREAREREERVARELAVALEEWQRYFDAAEPVARAAFDVHQPTEGYDRVICETCVESDCGEVTDATWPCITYARMKAAADA